MASTAPPLSQATGTSTGPISPVDFTCNNGRAVMMRKSITALNPLRIVPDETRYSLVFWGASGAVKIFPDSQNENDADGAPFDSTSSPIILSMPAHGVIVCMGFTVIASVPPVTLTYLISNVVSVACDPSKGNGRVKLRARITPRR